MKYNMNEWLADQLNSPVKKPLPVLSFPGTQLIGKNVEELVNDGHLQALCMKAIAAVIVLVGAFNVYFKMQNGDQDVKKTIMLTIGGCIAFIALSEALPLFFT